MIEEHTDPIAEAHAQASNLLRTLLTALATLADRRAQRRQAAQERQRHQSEAERRETEKRVEAEREAAYLVYRRVYDESWWAAASPRKLADAVVAAGTWAEADPRARDAWRELSEQLQARYGIDLEALARQADGTSVPAGEVASEVLGQVGQAQQAGQASDMPRAKRWEAKRWEAEVLVAAGTELGAQVIAAKGWPRLQAHLDGLQAAGQDPSAGLSAAIGSDKLHGASDKAAVLKYRLEHLDKYQGRAARPTGEHTRPTDAERLAGRRRAEQERRRDEPGRGGEG
jgi:hypothetical protein